MILDLCQSSFFDPNCHRIGSSEFGRLCDMNSIEAISQKINWHSIGIKLDDNWHQIGCQLVFNWQSICIRLEVNCHQIGFQLVSNLQWIGTSILF